LTWSVDRGAGDLFVRNIDSVKNEKFKKYLFTINNHYRILILKKDNIDLRYMKIVLQSLFEGVAKSYDNKKVGTNQIEDLMIKIPIDTTGKYALEKQHVIADEYEKIERDRMEIKNNTMNWQM